MKIIRWFLSHIFLILLVVTVIYGYMFWGNLTGENTPAGKAVAYLSNEFVVVGEFVEAVKAKQAQLSTESDESDESDESVTVASSDQEMPGVVVEEDLPVASTDDDGHYAQFRQGQAPPVESQAPPVESQAPPVESQAPPVVLSQQNQAPQVMTNGQRNTASRSVESPATITRSGADNRRAALAPPSGDAFIPANVEKQLNNVDNKGRVIDPSLQTIDVRNSWLVARKSYYQRKYDVSEKSYQDVIDNTQDNVDAYGELGNVYFNQGKNKQAAQAYFSAASILIRKGQVNRARGLLGLLRHLDEEKAVELQRLITSATS